MGGYDRRQGPGGGSGGDGGSGGSAPGRRTQVQRLAVQRKSAGAASGDVHDAAARGVSGAGGAIPHQDAIQKSFGPAFDVSSIRAHVGGGAADAARDIGASAYATGNDVAFGEAPDLHTAAHEAAHVVQQAQGVNLYGGVGEAGDAYERHADAIADRVVAGESAADLLGGGPGSGAASRGVQRKDGPKEPEDPVLDPLIAGDCLDAGKGEDTGFCYVFHDARMDAAFTKLCGHWGIPMFPELAEKKDEAKKASGGDSEGKHVGKLPTWFNAMQNKVIGSAKWGKAEKASQALMDACLRANYPGAPGAVKEFFHQVGKSETNKASDEFVAGSCNSGVWCAQASSVPLLKALNDAGYRFKARTATRDMKWANIKAGQEISVHRQADLYSIWANENPKADPDGKIPPAHLIGLPAASTAPLEPGDIISLVSMATPSSGHVGTVVEFKDPTITMVSGNAGGAAPGQGAVRIEDTKREPMPAKGRWDQTGQNKVVGETNPDKPGVIWVVSIIKSSQLDPKHLDVLDDAGLARLGIEKQAVTA